METPTSPRKPCSCGHESQPKILQNLLHNFPSSDTCSSNQNHRQSPQLSQPPRCHSSQGSVVSMHSPYAPSNRQSPMSPSSEYNHLIQSYNRQRSCSAASLGSTGSSRRESYSPSRDSTSSHESYSRVSPVSMGPSPSPSPPAHNGSKLFGLLKGTMSSPYSSLYKSLGGNNNVSCNIHNSSSSTDSNHNRSHTPIQSPGSQITKESPIPHYISRSPAAMYNSFRPHEQYSSPPPSLLASTLLGKRSYDCDETPMDLSCKKPKVEHEKEQIQHTTDSHSANSSCAEVESNASFSSSSSILQSILCGKASKLHSLLTIDTDKSSSSSARDNCRSPQESQMNCKSPEPTTERRDSLQSSCFNDQRVTLVKKMMLPIRARVSDWLVKVIQYARTQPEFASLPHNDKVTLVLNAWSRIMLLFMAETNFQFAVTPVSSGEDSNRSTPDSRSTPIGRETDDHPTMQSVDTLQNFIRKCQNLNLDGKEYHFFKMAVLFHPGYYGLENGDFVEKVNSYSRQALQDHIRSCRPDDRSRYSTVLLSINTILSGINCKVIENLFCRHISKDTDMEVLLKEMLLNYDQ